MTMAPRRRCQTCGSCQWHKEPSSGLIACSEGHVLQNYRSETTEVEEMGPHARKKRALKSTRKKKEVGSNADPKLYHGARGRYHYFLCLQLLLRQQIAALTKLWDLPPEFEVICRDIWALHLSLLPDTIPAEPHNYAQANLKGSHEAEKEDGKGGRGDSSLTPGIDGPQSPPKTVDDAKEQGGENDSDSDLNEYEIEQLMKENSDTSSSEDDVTEGKETAKPAAQKGARSKGHHLYETPVSTIAVLIVGCWTLRIPALYRDFSRIIELYELPYLDPVRLLPPSMVVHLTKHSKQALSPHNAPSTMLMHKVASRLGKKLYSSYGVFTPEANAAPILWRVVKAMGGIPVLYGLTKRVSSILSLPLTLHVLLAPGLPVIKGHEALRHQYDNMPPEVSLMASCIIILKMVYGLDGKVRLPKEKGDPACTFPGVEPYLTLLREMNEDESKSREWIFNSRHPMHLGEMNEEMMEDYIKFCEKVLLVPRPDEILDVYFPLSRGHVCVEEGVRNGRKRGPLTAMTMNAGDDGTLQAGEEYTIWNARDVLGTLPEEYLVVLRRGAKWVGVEEELLGGVIEKYERRLNEVERKRRSRNNLNN